MDKEGRKTIVRMLISLMVVNIVIILIWIWSPVVVIFLIILQVILNFVIIIAGIIGNKLGIIGNKLGIIKGKLIELRNLLIDKHVSEQKEIIIDFFHENRKISKHFKNFYKSSKDIFRLYSDDNLFIKEFIDKTFINFEIIDPYGIPHYSTLNLHMGEGWVIDNEEFEKFGKKIKKICDDFIWEGLPDSNDKKEEKNEMSENNEMSKL